MEEDDTKGVAPTVWIPILRDAEESWRHFQATVAFASGDAIVLERGGALVLQKFPVAPDDIKHLSLPAYVGLYELSRVLQRASTEYLRATSLCDTADELNIVRLVSKFFPLVQVIAVAGQQQTPPPGAPMHALPSSPTHAPGIYPLIVANCNYQLCVTSVEDASHPIVRPLLFWLREQQPDIIPTDLALRHRTLPSFFKVPLLLGLAFLSDRQISGSSRAPWPEDFIARLVVNDVCADDAQPPLFAHLVRQQCTREGGRAETPYNVQMIEPAFAALFLARYTCSPPMAPTVGRGGALSQGDALQLDASPSMAPTGRGSLARGAQGGRLLHALSQPRSSLTPHAGDRLGGSLPRSSAASSTKRISCLPVASFDASISLGSWIPTSQASPPAPPGDPANGPAGADQEGWRGAYRGGDGSLRTPVRPPRAMPGRTSERRPSSLVESPMNPNGSEVVKNGNKNMLKKLMLLSLRHVGIDKSHLEFPLIWKHLYCGCLFALRSELALFPIEQQHMLSIIRSNMNFLNVK